MQFINAYVPSSLITFSMSARRIVSLPLPALSLCHSNVRINPFTSVVSRIHGLSPILLRRKSRLDKNIETSGIPSGGPMRGGGEGGRLRECARCITYGVSNARRARQTHRCGINAYLRNVQTVSNLACRSAWLCSFNGSSGSTMRAVKSIPRFRTECYVRRLRMSRSLFMSFSPYIQNFINSRVKRKSEEGEIRCKWKKIADYKIRYRTEDCSKIKIQLL